MFSEISNPADMQLNELEFSLASRMDSGFEGHKKLLKEMMGCIESIDAKFAEQQARHSSLENKVCAFEQQTNAVSQQITESFQGLQETLSSVPQQQQMELQAKLDVILAHAKAHQNELNERLKPKKLFVEQRSVHTMTTPRLLDQTVTEHAASANSESSQHQGHNLVETLKQHGGSHRSHRSRAVEPIPLEYKTSEVGATRAESLMRQLSLHLAALEEPPREGSCATLLKFLAPLFLLVIVLNAGWIYYVVSFEVENPFTPTPFYMEAVEIAFVILYTFELMLRLSVHRSYFFLSREVQWNVLDLLLVVYSLSELTFDSFGNKLIYLRSIRVLRMAKVLRVFRLVKFVKQLRIILNCLMGSVMSLVWSIVMMLIVFFMFSMVFVQGVANLLRKVDRESIGPTIELFGSVDAAFLSLFKTTTGGDDWSVMYDALQPLGGFYPALYLFFVAFSHIAFLNILTGIFVDGAMKYATPEFDEEEDVFVAAVPESIDSQLGLEETAKSDDEVAKIDTTLRV
eukprot:TRINITY_DN2045_c0_g2_i1.p1 TRINITY_DN2045_c0_g2~~TRINITY_DN2045_c0_g2_i1.p1  ORF type:complete len:515 (+),score=77.67 TRINITY_DN2045_c0_g2_i1:58-1602(+)